MSETATRLSLKLKSEEARLGWCCECASLVLWIKPDTAMKLFGSATLIEKHVVHFMDGRVCARSLLSN